MALFIFTMKILATEMYEIKNGLSLLIVMELFEQRNEQHCHLKKKCPVHDNSNKDRESKS